MVLFFSSETKTIASLLVVHPRRRRTTTLTTARRSSPPLTLRIPLPSLPRSGHEDKCDQRGGTDEADRAGQTGRPVGLCHASPLFPEMKAPRQPVAAAAPATGQRESSPNTRLIVD